MVDVVNLTAAVTQLDQHLDGFKNVVVGQRHGTGNVVATTQTAVDLHAAHTRQIVSVFAVEQTLRSDEQTSELQSLMRISYAVFCLKKKKETIKSTDHRHPKHL